MLAGQGFKEVYNLSGGIMAWDGGVAEGPVELNLEMVREDETPEAIINLAYGMEQSLASFYRSMETRTKDSELLKLLELLASIEDRHKQYLLELYKSIEPSGSSREVFEADVSAKIMEGGFDGDTFIQKNEKFLHSVLEMIDLSMMLETQALDLYLRFARKTDNNETKTMLFRIADEEKAHLSSLGRLREEKTP